MPINKSFVIFLVFLLYSASVLAQSAKLRGSVLDENGNTLGFTTIFIKELNNGSTSNAEGDYEIVVPSGTYTVFYQYMGYETQSRQVTVAGEDVVIDVRLKPQVLVLRDVTITAGKEDPAYTIMRKAIAKSKFHTQQLDRYTARVYMKGSAQLKDAPFFLRNRLKKEGVEMGQVFVQESVSEIEYIRPGT